MWHDGHQAGEFVTELAIHSTRLTRCSEPGRYRRREPGTPQALSPAAVPCDGNRWVACHPGFFLPVKVLSHRFRKLYLRYLEQTYAAGKLLFYGELQELRIPRSSPDIWRHAMAVIGWSTPRRCQRRSKIPQKRRLKIPQ
jgi:hypothetical protein